MGGQKASSAKDKFSRWFKNKKKSPSEKNVGPPRKSKGKGKGKDQGKDKGKSGKGKGKGKVGESERTPHASRPSLNLTPDDMGKAGVPWLCWEISIVFSLCDLPTLHAF